MGQGVGVAGQPGEKLSKGVKAGMQAKSDAKTKIIIETEGRLQCARSKSARLNL